MVDGDRLQERVAIAGVIAICITVVICLIADINKPARVPTERELCEAVPGHAWLKVEKSGVCLPICASLPQ